VHSTIHLHLEKRVTALPDRRAFIGLGLGGLVAAGIKTPLAWRTAPDPVDGFPRQNPEIVLEMVKVAHGNLPRVKQLLERQPALAKAAVDWGFGDWEDALGAASHTGGLEIAQLLISHGARPTLFSAAMMGQLDVVKGFIGTAPGCERILGPHSITLLAHARAGGEQARLVREYLEQVGGADSALAVVELSEADRSMYVGIYQFGNGPNDRLEIAAAGDALSINRPGMPFSRALKHLGKGEFFPIGAESVRIKFTVANDTATAVSVYDPNLVVTASRGR
jgi:hypothetical protein